MSLILTHRKKTFSLAAFLSFFLFSTAQNSQKYFLRYYNKQNNQLSENIISGLFVDDKRLLWITTPNGLFTFNGFAIEPYPAKTPERITSLFQNAAKKRLVTCADGKIYEVKNDTFIHFQNLPNTKAEEFSAYIFNNSKINGLKTLNMLGDSIANASAVFVSADNSIYLRKKHIIYQIKNGVFKTITSAFPVIGGDVFTDDKYWIFDTRSGTMHCINDASLKDVKIPFNAALTASNQWILEHSPNPVLVFQNRAWTFLKNKKTEQYEWREIADNIPLDIAVTSAYYSPELEKLFLGTIPTGLVVISKSRFSVFQHTIPKNTLDFYRYYVQIPQKNGYVISDFPQLFENTPGYFRSFFKNYDISYSYQHLDSTNIIGNTRDFYYTLDIATLKPRKISKQQTAPLQQQSYVLYGNKAYIFNNKGIFIYDRTKDSIYLKLKIQLGSDHVNQSTVINDKIFLSYCGGIMVYDPKRNRIEKHILKSTCFRNFFRYKNQIIVTTYGEGLHLLDSVNYAVKPLKSDYYNALKRTNFLYKDKKNFIWASTTNGILRIPGFSFDRMLAGKDFLPQPQYFDSKNGLPNDEMNGGTYPAYINFNDTLISAPGIMGIIQFHPLRDFPNRTAGLELSIKEIISLGKKLSLANNTLTLSSEMNEVKFHIQTVHWANPQNLNLYYRLNNNLHYVPYTDLSALNIIFENAGLQVLEFLYIDDLGKETTVLKISITKKKPWYQTVAFIFLSILIIAFIVLIASWVRTKNVEKKNRRLREIIDEKTQKIQEVNNSLMEKVAELTQLNKINNIYISVINHDVFAPIKYINVVGDKIYAYKDKLKKADILKHLELIVNSTKRLEILCSNILNERSSGSSFKQINQDVSINNMLTDLSNFVKIGLEINENNLVIKIPGNTTANTSANALNIILTNIVSNANRFTKRGQITITYKKTKGYHSINVTDTGNGMPAEVLEKIRNRTLQINHKDGTEFQSYGIGYSLIFKMLDIINGQMEIQSETLKGTSVTLLFPDLTTTDN